MRIPCLTSFVWNKVGADCGKVICAIVGKALAPEERSAQYS